MAIRSGLLAALWLLGSTTHAAGLEEVIITSERIGDGDRSIPAVTVERRADFLVQRVRLVNDTRAAEGRSKELYETVRLMVADAARHRGMALGHGSGFFLPIDPDARDLTLMRSNGRPDTDQTDIYVKVAITPGEDVARAVDALLAFIEKARVSGRTEVIPVDDISLSIVAPEQYRQEIVAKIAQDIALLRSRLGDSCRMEVSGLEQRVQWERSDLAELTLFIPYEARATGCADPAPP
jgi:hypothetical protein